MVLVSSPTERRKQIANRHDLLPRKIKAQEERRPAPHGPRDNPAVSVREQDRHAHVLEHVAGDAAQHHLTQARVTVAAHDEEIGFLLVGLRQNQPAIAVPPLCTALTRALIS